MARPKKEGLLYFSFDTDFFYADKRIKALRSRYGSDGLIFYIYLLTEIYRNGYYIRWDEDSIDNAIVDLGLTEGLIEQIMTFLVSRSLLNKSTLANSDTIITSPGIQKRYQEAVKSLKRDVYVDTEIWLLSKEETASCIKYAINDSKSEKNHSKSEKNYGKSKKNSTKETKGNENKMNDNSFVESPAEKSTVVFDADSFEIRCVDILIESCLKSFPNSKVPRTLSEKQKWAIEIDRMKRIDGRSEPDIMKALNFAVKDTFWQTNIRSTKKFREKFETLIIRSASGSDPNCKVRFNNFKQREYDMGALEKELLGYGLSNMNETNHEKGD